MLIFENMKRLWDNIGGRKKLQRKDIDSSVDRISELPESIIHQIMSYLPATKMVVQTSVLSKTWYHFNASYPILDFDTKYFHRESLSKFSQRVYSSLHYFSQNRLRVLAFSVGLHSASLYSDLDCWIGLALENGVKKISIDALAFYALPEPIFFSKTLTILNLTFCDLDQSLSLFGSLRKLELTYCRMVGPIILENDDCPLLEEFVCSDCEGLNAVVHILDLLRLHTVEVSMSFCGESFIDEFVVSGQSVQIVTIRDEYKPPVINIDGCNQLKLLNFYSYHMNDIEFHHFLSKFPLLEELYVFHCYELQNIKISNPQLKTLVVSLSSEDKLKMVEIAAPSLKSFIFASDCFQPNHCRIRVADCCFRLETLVLFKYMATERTIQNLISKFPSLQNLWIIGFPELQRIRIQNPQLMRLHFVRCLKLKAVKVDSPNLHECCYTGLEPPEFSVADMKASGDLRFEHETSEVWFGLFKNMLINIGVKGVPLIGLIANYVRDYFPADC